MDTYMKDIPRFAVVGHPNKGKSSIVSALAQDDSVQISDTPGTTKKRRVFPLKVDNKIIYELIDTPGFQRARSVLSYIDKKNLAAHEKFERINKFINENRNNPKFNDEIELLEPIMQGAGIIYVVDGSKPYGLEYEPQMEILRFTGKASMALINMIGDEDYSLEWKNALSQYFKIVKKYNPLKAKFIDNIELLEAVSYLNEDWTKEVKDSILILKANHEEKIEATSLMIAQNMANSITLTQKIKLKGKEATKKERELLKQKYRNKLISLEVKAQKDIEKLWHHNILQIEQDDLNILDNSLFSKQSQSIFGLSKNLLLLTGLTSGGLAGVGVDIAVGGSSLMAGSIIGAAIGGTGAIFGYDKLADIKILGQKIGKKELKIGPVKNINFPYILLNRSLLHAKIIINRSHALREKELLKSVESISEQFVDRKTRKQLEKLHTKFRKSNEAKYQDIEDYKLIILDILKKV
jgi:GTPase SAR1 family protein